MLVDCEGATLQGTRQPGQVHLMVVQYELPGGTDEAGNVLFVCRGATASVLEACNKYLKLFVFYSEK